MEVFDVDVVDRVVVGLNVVFSSEGFTRQNERQKNKTNKLAKCRFLNDQFRRSQMIIIILIKNLRIKSKRIQAFLGGSCKCDTAQVLHL